MTNVEVSPGIDHVVDRRHYTFFILILNHLSQQGGNGFGSHTLWEHHEPFVVVVVVPQLRPHEAAMKTANAITIPMSPSRAILGPPRRASTRVLALPHCGGPYTAAMRVK